MIRYFAQGRFGPWYEVESAQWQEFGLADFDGTPERSMVYEPFDVGFLRCVVVNTYWLLRDDLKRDFRGLEDLIYAPDMKCGECGGRLTDEHYGDPDKRFPHYIHATGMLDRHGAWPVERWND